MSDYDNTNRGVLFKNNRREKESHPGYTGTINAGGVDYYLSAWVKDGKSGKFFSLSLKPKDAAPQPAPPAFDDSADIPF